MADRATRQAVVPPRTTAGMLDELDHLRQLARGVRWLVDTLARGRAVTQEDLRELTWQLEACEDLMPATGYGGNGRNR